MASPRVSEDNAWIVGWSTERELMFAARVLGSTPASARPGDDAQASSERPSAQDTAAHRHNPGRPCTPDLPGLLRYRPLRAHDHRPAAGRVFQLIVPDRLTRIGVLLLVSPVAHILERPVASPARP